MAATVGVIGVGAMGLGIVRSLVRGGFETLGRDIDSARESLAKASGARVVASAAQLGAAAQVSIVVVVDAAQIEEVLAGSDGLLAGLAPGRVVMLCSTIAPADAERFAARIEQAGALALDAPISGGPARAEAGTMSIMLAGARTALEATEPVLAAIAGKRFVIGERHGDAMRAKLVNNLMAGIHLMAGAEALALAERLGLDSRAMFELIAASSGQSWIFEDRMARALVEDFRPRAAAHVLAKDLTLANEAAGEAGLELPLGALARDLLRATCEGGWRLEDDAAALKYYRRRFGA